MSRIGAAWQVVDGDVLLPELDARWWAAVLATAVGTMERRGDSYADVPGSLAVVRLGVEDLPELTHAAMVAAMQVSRADADPYPSPPAEPGGPGWRLSVRVEGGARWVVVAPGCELLELCHLVGVFTAAALDPTSAQAALATPRAASLAWVWVDALTRVTAPVGLLPAPTTGEEGR